MRAISLIVCTPPRICPDLTAFSYFAEEAPPKETTREEISAFGDGIVHFMTESQLLAAVAEYHTKKGARSFMMVAYRHVKQVLANHWRSCLKMPAGGGHAGGAQQSGFEVALMTSFGAQQLFGAWPNYQSVLRGHSWECRTMEECSSALNFEGWGALNGKPIPKTSGSTIHSGILLVGPPCTVVWRLRSDTTSVLTVRFPIIIHTAEATILPPDDLDGTPFYVDPPERQGMHRDLFRDWGRKVVGELHVAGFAMQRSLVRQMPLEYQSGESSGSDSGGS